MRGTGRQRPPRGSSLLRARTTTSSASRLTRRSSAARDGTSSSQEPESSRWSKLSTRTKSLIIFPAIAAVISALVSLLFNVYGSDIADTVHAGSPLRFTVQLQDTASYGGVWWLSAPLAATTIDLQSQLPQILVDDHAVDTGSTTLLLTVEGERSHTSVITDVRANIISRSEPLTAGGTIIAVRSQGGQESIRLGLNLEDATPRARSFDGSNATFSTHYFDSHTVTVAQGETVTFIVDAYTKRYDVRYGLIIDAIVDGKATQITVTDGAAPFRTRGYSGHYDKAFIWNGSEQLDAIDPATIPGLAAGGSATSTPTPSAASAP